MGNLSKFAPSFLSVLRIVSALLFLQHGTQKHFSFPVEAMGPLEPWSQLWIGGWLEIIGGVLLVLGLFTRPVAFLMSGMMAVAYFQFHAAKGGLIPIANGGELAIMFCFVFLYLVFAGGGSIGVDAMRKRD